MNNWIEQMLPIIEEFKDGSDEALDGDDVDRLCTILKAKINLQEGNITQEEYDLNLDSIYTLQQYASEIGYDGALAEDDWESLKLIQDYAQEFLDESIWDYPRNEILEVKTEKFWRVKVCGEVRICELI